MQRLLPLLLTAACAAPPAQVASVERVILYTETVTVLMSDGTLCVSDRPGRATAWSSQLEGCPHDLGVEVRARSDAPREELSRGGMRVIVAGEGWG